MSFIKMDRKLAERLTLLAGYLNYRGDDSPYTLIRRAYEEGHWRHPVSRIFSELTRDGFNSIRDVTYTDLMSEAAESLRGGVGDETHLPRLVSVIVELLQHPYGQNVLAGDTLKRLRKAVLLPEELAAVSANAAGELRCGNCGKPFADGELTTFMGGERGNPLFSCTRCVQPTMATCHKAGCEGSGDIDYKLIAKAVSKADCGMHNKVEPIPQEIRQGGGIIIENNNPFEGHPHDMPRPVDPQPPPMPPPGMRDRIENEVVRRLRERRPGRLGR